MSSFAELLRAIDEFDVADYLSDKGFRSLRAEEWVGPCPHCHKDDKVAVNVEKKTFHCWVCQQYETAWDEHAHVMRRRPVSGAGGLLKLVEWLEGTGPGESIQFVLDAVGHGDISELPDKLLLKRLAEALDSGRAPAINPPEGAQPILAPLPYMLRRGVTMKDVADYGLFWCSGGRYDNRLVFPVWEDGFLVYWQARAMYERHEAGGKFTKALNPPRTPGAAVSSDVLMNLDVASQYPRVCLVEGPMDVVRTGPDSACTFGKKLHPRQVQKLLDRGVRAVDLMWDGPTPTEPDGAHVEMVQLAPWLASFFDVRLVFLPSGDPGDWDRASLNTFRAYGLPAAQLDSRRLTLR